MKQKIILLTICLLCSYNLSTQAQNKKVGGAIKQLLTSNFIMSFDSMANVVEAAGLEVKSNANLYNDDQIQQLETGYDNSVKRLNNILDKMKYDFLDKNRLKLMLGNPAVYSDSYKLQLNEAATYYEENFVNLQQRFSSDSEIDALGFPAIFAIVQGTFELFKMLQDFKRELRKLTEQAIDQHFVQPHQVKMWKEL